MRLDGAGFATSLDVGRRHLDLLSQGKGTEAHGSDNDGHAGSAKGHQRAEAHGSKGHKSKAGEGDDPHDKQDQQHRRDDIFDRHGSSVSYGEKEALKTNPELKNRQAKDPRAVQPAAQLAKKSEHTRRDERLEAQSVPNSVFGRDRVTLSPEVQLVPAITRKSEAVGVKKNRSKCLPPGLNSLAAKANPAPKGNVTPPPPSFGEFLGAFVNNFS